MRILHVCDGMPPATLGGAGTIMCGLARAQATAGHEIHILTAAAKTTVARSGPWTVHTIPALSQRFAHWRGVFSVARAREVMTIIEHVKPDVIHVHAVAFQIGYRWMKPARTQGFPIVLTCHDAMLTRYGKVIGNERFPAMTEAWRFRWSYNPVRHRMIRRLLKNANVITVVSDALRIYLARSGIGPMRTTYNGIDTSTWKPRESQADARARLGLPQDTCIFLIAGRLDGEKGLATALHSLPPEAHLIIAGEASLPEGFPNRKRLHVFPQQSPEQMRELYAACDAALVPSPYLDPFPTVCLEAMAMARPVLATSMGGAKESVADGETGWIIDPLDPWVWKQRMEWCSYHRAELESMGKAARKRAEERFDIARMAADVQRIYEEVCTRRIVLLVPDTGGTSGWSRYALDLGHALANRGHELHCLVAEKTDASWCVEYPVLRQPTSYLNNPLLCLLHAWRVWSLLRRLQPDVVHIIAEPYALMFPLMGTQRWKTVLTIHGTYAVVPLTMGRITNMLAARYYKKMDRIVSVSAFTKTYLSERMPVLFAAADLERKITVIHNAISLEGIVADTTQRATDRTFSILSVSGVKRKKGYLESVRAIRRFLDAHPVKMTYDIVGNDAIDPSFTRELLAEVSRLKLEGVVNLRGKLSDAELDAAYRSADLFLLPSLQEDDYFEGFGLVFIEANARGTPTIGGDTGGCPEAIEEGVSGYVCPPANADAIAARMEDVLLKNAIDRASCTAWAAKHDVTVAVENIERIYR